MNIWDYYSTVWQSPSNDLTCLASWEQTSILFSLRVRHMGYTEEAGGLRSITGKDSPSPSGPFTTFKDTRGTEATGGLSAIPQHQGLPPELPVTTSLPHNLRLQPGREAERFKLQLFFSTEPSWWGVLLTRGSQFRRTLPGASCMVAEDSQDWATVRAQLSMLIFY